MTTEASRQAEGRALDLPGADTRGATSAPRGAPGSAAGSRLALLALVFAAGVVSLAIEMCGPRLIAPYFGTSLSIWANQIGFTLVYLSLGYAVGGRIADRYPRPAVLAGVTAVAALATALIPLLSGPVLDWSVAGLDLGGGSVFARSLVPVLVLFSVPTILMGMVSPFAIRLSVERIGSAGRGAGRIYALSTAGSILGAFLPVLVLIPAWGVRATLYVCCVALLAASSLPVLAARLSRPSPR